MSFEAIGLNLVNQPDFVSLDVVKEDISMKAERVSWRVYFVSTCSRKLGYLSLDNMLQSVKVCGAWKIFSSSFYFSTLSVYSLLWCYVCTVLPNSHKK